MNTYNPFNRHRGVTLLIVLAMMVMFAMLVTTFMVIVSLNRRNAEHYAKFLTGEPSKASVSASKGSGVQNQGECEAAFQLLLVGSKNWDNVVAPHSILENLYGHQSSVPFGGMGAGYDEASTSDSALLSLQDSEGKSFALRPNILAPSSNGNREYLGILGNVQMNPDYTAPDYMTMFLAWNDFKNGKLERVIPSFHRPQLVRYWNDVDPTELRKYVLRPLPTDHPSFTGSNPAANFANLKKFLTEGPWDVDNDGDGRADGIWLDIGLPVKEHTTGTLYKPLISFYVIDMDGRINVNTIGNLKKRTEPNEAMGMGLGSAELYSDLLTEDILTKRYGSDGKPGGTNNDLLNNNGINIDAYTKGGLVADWLGTTPMEFDNLGNRKMGTPLAVDDIPYLMDPYPSANNSDTPFDENNLESLLRSVIDMDYSRLPHEFRNLLGNPYNPRTPALPLPELRYSLTARSSDIPVAAINHVWTESGYTTLHERAQSLGGDALWNLLPGELTQWGKKVNLNRLALRDDWMDGGNALLKAKAQFVQEIFYLFRILLHEQIKDQETLERLAQWSVNLVDFIDPDDAMTPFIFQTSPTGNIVAFDNSTLIEKVIVGTLTARDLSNNDCKLIWGLEKSEVVISETFAVHDRKVSHNNGNVPEFVQKERPQGSLFVELYRQGNPQRNYSASHLVEPDGTLNLAKQTSAEDYVWRLAIGEATKTEIKLGGWDKGNTNNNALYQLLNPDNGEIKYPQFYQWSNGSADDGHYHPDLGSPERFIWFGKELHNANAETRRRSFVNAQENNVALAPDSLLVIAPRNETIFTTPPATVNLPAIQTADPTRVRTMIATNPEANIFLADGSTTRGLGGNVSEPLPTQVFGDGYGQSPSSSMQYFDGRVPGTIPRQFGTVLCYKTICLQRLADPNRAHDPLCNPYLTVDWSMLDLQVINSDPTRETEKTALPDNAVGEGLFVSRQWNQKTPSGLSNIWDRILEGVSDTNGVGLDASGPTHTFGVSDYSKLIHFPWNDAPFMNTGELMLVPATAPGRFGVEFHDNGTSTDFCGDMPRFGYRYNRDIKNAHLYRDWCDSAHQRLFDFVHVPSRFTGAITSMREPGKINLNTVTEKGWEALKNGREGTFFPSYQDFYNYRQFTDTFNVYTTPTEFRPFRSPSAMRLTPKWAIQGGPPLTTATVLDWYRMSISDLVLLNREADNPYTALENIMRLFDVTTTRSNVFAIWITVGYFKVEKVDYATFRQQYPALSHIDSRNMFNAVYPDGYLLREEMGLDDGAVRRYMEFYLIDRSALVGSQPPYTFVRGEEQGTENIILKKISLEQGMATQTNKFRDDSATITPSPPPSP